MPHVRGHSAITLEQLRNIARANEPVPPKPPATVPTGAEPPTYTLPSKDVTLDVGGAPAPLPQLPSFEGVEPFFGTTSQTTAAIAPGGATDPSFITRMAQGVMDPVEAALEARVKGFTQLGPVAPVHLPAPTSTAETIGRGAGEFLSSLIGGYGQKIGETPLESAFLATPPGTIATPFIPAAAGLYRAFRPIASKIPPGQYTKRFTEDPITRGIGEVFPAIGETTGAAARTTAAKQAAARAEEMARGLHAKVAIAEHRAVVARQAREALEAKIPLARKRLDMSIVQAGEEVSPIAALPGAAPAATARSIDELIEAGGRIPQEVSFPISIRRTEGLNNLDYSQEIIRVRNQVDIQIRQFGDGPIPERLFSRIDEELNIDVPSTLREASSVLTQASEKAARLGQRKLREADELLDQAKADQIQRGIDAIGLTDAPAAALPGAAPAARVGAKEPWQMTRDEWRDIVKYGSETVEDINLVETVSRDFIKNSGLTPGYLKEVIKEGLKTGKYSGGELVGGPGGMVYKVVPRRIGDNPIQVMPKLRYRVDPTTDKLVVSKKDIRYDDIINMPLFHRTKNPDLSLTDLTPQQPKASIFAGNNYRGIFFSPNPGDVAYGKNVIEASIDPRAKIVDAFDLPDFRAGVDQTDTALKQGIDVIYRGPLAQGGDPLEIIVINPKVLRRGTHERSIRTAVAEGKSVPDEVLRDYPDLAAATREAAGEAPAAGREVTGEARRVFSAAERDVDRVIRNEVEFFLETSDDQLRAAREAERQANIKLADTQAMSRGRIVKEELTKSDLERGRIVGPQPQTIPTTSGTSMPANDLADGFTLQTTSAGTKRVRVETVLPNELTNAGAVSSAPKGKFVGSMRPIEEIVPEVVGIDNPVGRFISSSFVNPATALRSPSGKLLIAYQRQRVAIGELIETSLASALDSHAQIITGRMPLKINSQGFWGNTGKQWNDVFSRPNDFNLSTAERAYIDDFLTVVSEIEAERIAAGLTPIPKFSIEGWLYVPRQVREVGGVTIKRPTNPKLWRFHEEAVDGHSQGIRYEADPRATLSSHMRSAYDEILKKQLDDALEPLSITPQRLIPQGLRDRMSKLTTEYIAAKREVNRLRVPRIGGDILSKEQLAAEKTLRAALASERKAAQRNLDEIRPKYDKTKDDYRRALIKAKSAEVAPGELFGLAKGDISVHLWKNKFLPYEDAKILSEVIGNMGGRPSSGFEALGRRSARGMELIGNQVRFLSAVGDFAEPFIQGLPVLSTNPRVWWKATTRHYAAFANPRVQARYIKENRDTFLEMSSYGIPVGDPEFFAALSQGQGLSIGQLLEALPKGAEARRLLQVGGKQSFGRFQASYNTGLSVARAELWKSLKPTWNDSLDELAAYVRNLTGGLDSRALGVGPSQRGFESVWMAFSPRLLRSSVALVSDAVRGSAAFVIPGSKATARQQASMKTMAGFIGGVHGVYILSGLSIGKSWDEIMEGLNPLNGKKYLSHRINDDWIGVGGQIRAMIQLQFKIARVIKSGDIDDFISLSTYDNPLLQMAASRGAVGLRIWGTVVEGLSGGRIDALPYAHVDSISDIFLHLGKSTLPFSVQGKLDGEGVVATIASEIGARTSAGLPTEKLADLRQQVMTKHDIPGDFYSKTFDADAKDEVDALGGQDIEQMKKEVSKWYLEQGNKYEVYKVDRAEAIKEFKDKVNAAFEKMLPLNRGRDFRLQVSKWQRDLHEKKKALKEQHSTALEFFEELEPSESVFQDAIDVYISTLENAGLEDTVTGDYDYAKRNKILEYLSKDEELGAEMVERIETYLHKNDPEPIKQLRADREFLKPYFEIERNLVIAAGLEKKYEIYLNKTLLGPVLAEAFLDDPNNKRLAKMIKGARKIRKGIRESDLPKNREIQKRLFFWGYIDTPPPEAIPGLVERYRKAVPREDLLTPVAQ